MKPYYQDASVTLYHGDCREVLPSLATESVDLLVTDPPYGVRWQSASRRLRFEPIAGDESVDAAFDGVRLALRVLRVNRHVYVFGPFDLRPLTLTDTVELIWDKGKHTSGNLEIPWGSEHEYIQFAVYTPPTWTGSEKRGGLTARMRKGSVLNVPRLNATAVQDHPSEKPVRLLRELIESSSCIGDTVLDPFAGIGSTLEAAAVEGRKAIGIELEERYCEIFANRRKSKGALTEMFQ